MGLRVARSGADGEKMTSTIEDVLGRVMRVAIERRERILWDFFVSGAMNWPITDPDIGVAVSYFSSPPNDWRIR
jgi:hypothetical protein